VSYFAVLFCGGVVVPIGVELKPTEIHSDLQYCDVAAVITDRQWGANLIQALRLETLPLLRHIVLLGDEEEKLPFPYGAVDYHSLQENGTECFPPKKRNSDDLALLLHTSGTTSRPKRVMLSHDNILSNVDAYIACLKLTAEDTVLISLPMHYVSSNTGQMLTHLSLGGRLVLMGGRFIPSAFYALVQQEGIVTFTGVPTTLLMLLKQGRMEQYDISSLRYICFAGSPMPQDKLIQLTEIFSSISFVQNYGLTETSPRITVLPPEDSVRKAGSIGKPIPGVKVSLLDDEARATESGGVGEIVVNGPNVMLGYYKQPDETRKVLRPEGLFTGDLAYTDSDGYFYLVGRRKNIVISGGINIYPEEIEELLLNHPAVREAVVTGEAHDMLGEVPVALIVLYSPDAASEEELLRYCSERMTSYKVPRRIEFREQLDKTYNAKMKRF
uniref:class I adenylate-forming enzyme family protein n=1 Tax=Candidatus Electrothrix sp. TaxID=2170559 RepID=UPI004055FE64